MNRYSYPGFLLIFFEPLLIGAGFIHDKKIDTPHLPLEQINTCYTSSLSNPCSEIEMGSIQTSSVSQGNNRFEKQIGHFTSGVKNLSCSFALCSRAHGSYKFLHLKKYLGHIYPFDNFW